MTPEARLAELGLTLPVAAPPAANYVPFVVHGGLIHVAGQIPYAADGRLILGLVGDTLDIEGAREAAARCGLGVLAQLKAAVNDLARVKLLKLNVFVASTPGFFAQPQVANGASDLMVAVLGEAGRHARAAVGVAALPLGVAVEIDAVAAFSAS